MSEIPMGFAEYSGFCQSFGSIRTPLGAGVASILTYYRIMDANKKRLNINVDDLANRQIKRRKKRNLNETIYYEINGKNVPVFTPEFLEQNRIIEGELRKLRKLNNDFEEHNSVLIKYIESLSTSCDHAAEELKELIEFRDLLASQLTILKSEIKDKHLAPSTVTTNES